MASFEGNIKELFNKAFGIYAELPVYFPGSSVPEVRAKEGRRHYAEVTGAYLFDRFEFQVSGTGVSFEVPIKGGLAQLWALPEATVVNCSRSKNMVYTIMAGRTGSVKELISNGDWQFTFSGFIINNKKSALSSKQEHLYPMQHVKQMSEVFSVGKSFRIYSRLINNLHLRTGNTTKGEDKFIGVTQVVVTDLEFPSLEGYDNVQPYRMTCVSDEDYVLDLGANAAL